jgi:hypothetical protein
LLIASLVVGCTASESRPGGSAGASGTAGRSGSGGASGGSGSGSAGSGSAGTGSAGTSGAGTSGSAGAGGATLDAGVDHATGGSSGAAGGSGANPDSGLTTAGCANHDYQLCLDFESGIDTTIWSGGNANGIETTEVAHGGHAYHLYSDNKSLPQGGAFKATKLGTIKDQLWGRFYIHFAPGAPGGHGNIVGAYDQGNNWYEIGWQFDGIMGVWHSTNGERPTRSHPLIVDKWYCIESFFDGTKTNMPQWWIDGDEAQYYKADNLSLIPKIVTQFMTITVGWTPYAGLGLQMPDGLGPTDPRLLNDAWIDDVAFDTKRIHCIE